MIWVQNKLVPDDELRVSALDRTFAHGLGLFETFRTWNGHATLMKWHVARVTKSAQALELHLDPADLPDARAVNELIEAFRGTVTSGLDVRLRITVSGGRADIAGSKSLVWMTAGALPPSDHRSGAVITYEALVSPDDPLVRHKSLNYWRQRIAQAQAAANGTDDALYLTPAGLICETSRANIFLVESGRLYTPSTDGPLLPGVMRAAVIERAQSKGIDVVVEPLPRHRIATASEAFLTNSVRGMLPIARLLDRELPAPGPVTGKLWADLLPWLESGGITP
jgi:branched-chain amino acid aminotransferase